MLTKRPNSKNDLVMSDAEIVYTADGLQYGKITKIRTLTRYADELSVRVGVFYNIITTVTVERYTNLH